MRSTDVDKLKVLKAPSESGTQEELSKWIAAIETHVNVTWSQGHNVTQAVLHKEKMEIEKPVDYEASEKTINGWVPAKKLLWNASVLKYGEQLQMLVENKKALYALMLGNVSGHMKSRITSNSAYEKENRAMNATWLHRIIMDIMSNYETETKQKDLSNIEQIHRIVTLKQEQGITNVAFIRQVTNEMNILERKGGELFWTDDLEVQLGIASTKAKKDYASINSIPMTSEQEEKELKQLKKILMNKPLAIMILHAADKKRFGPLCDELNNAYLLGQDKYPSSPAELLKLLNNYKSTSAGPPQGQPQTGRTTVRFNTGTQRSQIPAAAASFLQTNGQARLLRGKSNTAPALRPNTHCTKCKYNGHYYTQCPFEPERNNPTTGTACGAPQETSNTTGQE